MPTAGIDDGFATVEAFFSASFCVGLGGGVPGTVVSSPVTLSLGGFFEGVEGVLLAIVKYRYDDELIVNFVTQCHCSLVIFLNRIVSPMRMKDVW